MDVGGWLRRLGLEQYEAAFRENDIDDTVLPSLTAEELEGARCRILSGIAASCSTPVVARAVRCLPRIASRRVLHLVRFGWRGHFIDDAIDATAFARF
jgi:hypothetical protein